MMTQAMAHRQSAKAQAVAAATARGEPPRAPLTRIIATVGPACSDRIVVRKLIDAGVSVFRLNFGHGVLVDHAQRLATIRAAAADAARPIAVMGDLQGPKIRLRKISGGEITVPTGGIVVLHGSATDRQVSAGEDIHLSCTHPEVVQAIEPGQRVLINDGAVRLLAVERRPDEVRCVATIGGDVASGKGVNVPDTELRLPVLHEADWRHAEWAIASDLDMLAMSFVSRADDVVELREGIDRLKDRIGRVTMRMPIVAKIERPGAVERIDEIADAADAVMIARGDLGVEMDLARVPVLQKQLLAAVHAWGKPCVVATQMLESMIQSTSPTRAEASDVATAIFDGADAIMLSGETAVGAHPVLAVETAARIARQTEAYLATVPAAPKPPARLVESRYRTAALAHGAWTVAQDLDAKFIVVWSQQGGGARYLSQNDFMIPIIACSTDDRALRQMQLLRGVTPVHMPLPEHPAHFTRMVDGYLQESGWAQPGDVCVLLAGGPIGRQGATNALAIHTIGDVSGGFAKHGE